MTVCDLYRVLIDHDENSIYYVTIFQSGGNKIYFGSISNIPMYLMDTNIDKVTASEDVIVIILVG